MISIHQINEYLYCKRRFFYLRNLQLNPKNWHIEEGSRLHKKYSANIFSNLLLEDEMSDLKGKFDYLSTKDKLTLIELKKAKAGKIWKNDEYQAIAYICLARNKGLNVNRAFIKYQNKQFRVRLAKNKEEELKKILDDMKNQSNLPQRCSNIRKCNGCNLKQYCWI